MKIEVSNGEMIDKYSILEIKWNKIQDEEKKIEIKKEMNELNLTQFHNTYFFSYYYKLLFYVNQKIWDLTDLVKPINIESYEYTDDLKEYIQMNSILTEQQKTIFIMYKKEKRQFMILDDSNKWIETTRIQQESIEKSKTIKRKLAFDVAKFNDIIGFIGYGKKRNIPSDNRDV